MQRSLFTIAMCILSLTYVGVASGNDTDPLTRGQAAKLLLQIRTPVLPPVKNSGNFVDVPQGTPDEKYIILAQKLGILSSDNQQKLHPSSPVSRGEFLKMLTQTFGLTTHTSYSFKDVRPFSWVAPYAGVASHYNLFAGNAEEASILQADLTLSRKDAQRVLQTLADGGGVSQQPSTSDINLNADLIPTDIGSASKQSVISVNTLTTPPSQAPIFSIERPDVAAMKKKLIDYANGVRLKHDLPPLHPDAFLTNSAQKYADQLFTKNFFSHVSPTGETLKDRMQASGYYNPSYQEQCFCIKRFMVGENIARGQKDPKQVMVDWMNSPTHAANILSTDFTDVGVGMAAGNWVMHFGGVIHSDEK